MTLLNHLEFQPIDAESDQDEITSNHQPEEVIDLNRDESEEELDAFWDGVVSDIHKDPTWYDFSEK